MNLLVHTYVKFLIFHDWPVLIFNFLAYSDILMFFRCCSKIVLPYSNTIFW
jgi:hypothetical protein